MVKPCETQEALVLNSGVAKGTPSRAQAIPNSCCVLPPGLQINQNTLIESSGILLKQSVNIIDYVNYI